MRMSRVSLSSSTSSFSIAMAEVHRLGRGRAEGHGLGPDDKVLGVPRRVVGVVRLTRRARRQHLHGEGGVRLRQVVDGDGHVQRPQHLLAGGRVLRRARGRAEPDVGVVRLVVLDGDLPPARRCCRARSSRPGRWGCRSAALMRTSMVWSSSTHASLASVTVTVGAGRRRRDGEGLCADAEVRAVRARAGVAAGHDLDLERGVHARAVAHPDWECCSCPRPPPPTA